MNMYFSLVISMYWFLTWRSYLMQITFRITWNILAVDILGMKRQYEIWLCLSSYYHFFLSRITKKKTNELSKASIDIRHRHQFHSINSYLAMNCSLLFICVWVVWGGAIDIIIIVCSNLKSRNHKRKWIVCLYLTMCFGRRYDTM